MISLFRTCNRTIKARIHSDYIPSHKLERTRKNGYDEKIMSKKKKSLNTSEALWEKTTGPPVSEEDLAKTISET